MAVKRRNVKGALLNFKENKLKLSFYKLTGIITSIKWKESYTSLLMGIVSVILAVFFIVSFLKQTQHAKQTTSLITANMTSHINADLISLSPTTSPASKRKQAKKEKTNIVHERRKYIVHKEKTNIVQKQETYIVQKGDDLWHISEKFYKSGYNFVDIARVNNLSNPSMIFSGNELIIPNVVPKIATVVNLSPPNSQVSQSNSISGDSYVIQKGDNLWNIALRAYGDGYQWMRIAKENNLENPDIIFSGNLLKIPRHAQKDT